MVEAAHFDPVAVARSARRRRLSTEASRRFERGVDDALPAVAADRVADLLGTLGGGRADPGSPTWTCAGRTLRSSWTWTSLLG